MKRDKQLLAVCLETLLQKRERGQALNIKEFAASAGISYSMARKWFRTPGFPSFEGFIFWADFEAWRQQRCGVKPAPVTPPAESTPIPASPATRWTGRAARILRELQSSANSSSRGSG